MKMSAINARRVLAGVFAGCAVCAGISIALPTADTGHHGSRKRSALQRQPAGLLEQLFGTLERP